MFAEGGAEQERSAHRIFMPRSRPSTLPVTPSSASCAVSCAPVAHASCTSETASMLKSVGSPSRRSTQSSKSDRPGGDLTHQSLIALAQAARARTPAMGTTAPMLAAALRHAFSPPCWYASYTPYNDVAMPRAL